MCELEDGDSDCFSCHCCKGPSSERSYMVPGRYICSEQLCGNPYEYSQISDVHMSVDMIGNQGGVDEGGTLETGGWKNHFVYS